MKKKALGKGLGALFPEDMINELDTNQYQLIHIPIQEIQANPFQPRKHFDEQELHALSESIRVHGVLQPIIVRPTGDSYEIVAGERRWRAANLAALESIPALIISDDDRKAYEVALIENIQRVELNPIEEAEAYSELINKYQITQQELSDIVGKSRSQIANLLRLLSLQPYVRSQLIAGSLSTGHARALITLEPALQKRICEEIIKNDLSVREVEKLINKQSKPAPVQENQGDRQSDLIYKEISRSLADVLGTKVLVESKNNRGRIVIEFYNDEDLERITSVIK